MGRQPAHAMQWKAQGSRLIRWKAYLSDGFEVVKLIGAESRERIIPQLTRGLRADFCTLESPVIRMCSEKNTVTRATKKRALAGGACEG
jgi:hypothetical protein